MVHNVLALLIARICNKKRAYTPNKATAPSRSEVCVSLLLMSWGRLVQMCIWVYADGSKKLLNARKYDDDDSNNRDNLMQGSWALGMKYHENADEEDELYEELQKRGINVGEFRKMGLSIEELRDFVYRLDRLLERHPDGSDDEKCG
ncbi:hypothetical protein [Candidatus Nitrososphaera evergladensis]|nr:hypothetical protein [Candidatus Nitrososphaera evergladensis]